VLGHMDISDDSDDEGTLVASGGENTPLPVTEERRSSLAAPKGRRTHDAQPEPLTCSDTASSTRTGGAACTGTGDTNRGSSDSNATSRKAAGEAEEAEEARCAPGARCGTELCAGASPPGEDERIDARIDQRRILVSSSRNCALFLLRRGVPFALAQPRNPVCAPRAAGGGRPGLV